jgi:hypothetical protein
MSSSHDRSVAPRSHGTTLEGILVPRRWKATGKVAALALNTLDESEYVIEDPTWEERGFHEHLRKRVRLIGTVVGNRLVQIAAISVMDSAGMPAGPIGEGEE